MHSVSCGTNSDHKAVEFLSQPFAFEGEQSCAAQHFGGGGAGFTGAENYIADGGGHVMRPECDLLYAVGNLTRCDVLLFNSDGNRRCDLEYLNDRSAYLLDSSDGVPCRGLHSSNL